MKNILVIGGGLMGSAVAWKLAEQGETVTLIEQQDSRFSRGSSLGAARIARSLGPKKDVFSFVHNQTVKEVKKLLKFLNGVDKQMEHSMDEIYSTSPVSYLYHKDQYDQINQLRYKKQRKDYRNASGDTAFRKFGVTLAPEEVLVREKRDFSGTINPEALIKKLHLGIDKKGGEIRYQRKVISLQKKEDHFEVRVLNTTNSKIKTIRSKKIIVATGAHTVSILKNFAPYFNRVLTPKRVPIAYLKISQKQYANLSPLEVANLKAAQPMFSQIGKQYFSMIERIDADEIPVFKAGGHLIRRNVLDLDKVWDQPPRKKEVKWIKKQFRKYLEMLEIYVKKKEIKVVTSKNCVYSMTRSEVPLVTNIFNQYGSLDKDILVISGMSGIGAKGCLGYGKIGANIILDRAGDNSKIYRKAVKAFGNPAVRLYTRRIRRGRLF